jgi:hypothetical protein
MPARKWLDRTQPQTLMIATIVMYINAAFELLSIFATILALPFAALWVVSGWGIANEKKWGYFLACGVAIVNVVLLIALAPLGISLISLLFGVALVALLLHPQSREYQRIWFH